MPRLTHVQTSFNAGQFSERLADRSDLSKYANASRKFLNFLPLVQGPASNRTGTKRIADALTDTCKPLLIPFESSVDAAYVLEFGDLKMRVYKDRALVTSDISWNTLTVDQWDQLTVDQWDQMFVDSGAFELVTPWTCAQLGQLKYTQSADVLFVCHPKVRPQEIRRLADTSWTIVDFDFKDGPFLEINPTLADPSPTTLTPSGVTGSITLTASAVAGINGNTGFQSTDVDRLVRLLDAAGNWTWGRITAVTSTTLVDFDIVGPDLSSAAARDTWRLGAWSDTTGWPQVPMFHYQRLWFAATDTDPQTLYASKDDDIDNFAPTDTDGTVLDTSGFVRTIADALVNAIKWMESDAQGLLIGTNTAEFSGRSSGRFSPIKPDDFTVVRQTTHGSADNVKPYKIGNAVLFAQRSGRELREILFTFADDQFVANEMSLLADDLVIPDIAQLAYMRQPQSILWVILEDGSLRSMTYERPEDVVAWAPHQLGGSFQGGPPVVESIAVIVDEPYDLLYLAVKRTINGATKRSIEFLEDPFEDDANQDDAYFVDYGKTTQFGTPTAVVNGLAHLEGESASILGDGAVYPKQVVIGGQITLDPPVTKVHVGLGYDSILTTMRIIPERSPFEPRGKMASVYNIGLSVFRTLGGFAGGEETQLDEIDYRSTSDLMDTPPPLFSGVIDVSKVLSHTKDPVVTVKQSDPLPMRLLSITSEIDVTDV